jgi:hypothetical protein
MTCLPYLNFGNNGTINLDLDLGESFSTNSNQNMSRIPMLHHRKLTIFRST